MNKAELVAAVAEKTALSKKDSEKAVNAAFEAITAALVGGDKVQLVGFGAFEVKQRNARPLEQLGIDFDCLDIHCKNTPRFLWQS